MSQKKRRELHDSLSNIIKRQNEPIADKTKMSANLLASFAPAEKKELTEIDEDSNRRQSDKPQSSSQRPKSPVATKNTVRVPRVVESINFKENIEADSTSYPQRNAVPNWTETRPFSEFSSRWTPFLRPAQLAVCRAIWDMTYAIGQTECLSSMAKLATAAKLSERQCYRSVEQLERRGFVERPEVFNTAKTKGTVFILHTLPIQPHLKRKRIYHVGG